MDHPLQYLQVKIVEEYNIPYLVIINNITTYYYKYGTNLLHRENDLPAVVFGPNKICEWWFDGLLHRTNGPAITTFNVKHEWWIHGQRHREDGPAIIYPNGDQYWWYQDQEIKVTTQEEFVSFLKLKPFM